MGMGMGGMGMGMGGMGMGMGPMMGGMATVPQEKLLAVYRIQDEYSERLFTLRQNLRAKEAELEAIMLQARPDTANAKAAAKEIASIQEQMLDLGIDMHAQIIKETGIRLPMQLGGMGMMGMGMGGGGMGGMGCMSGMGGMGSMGGMSSPPGAQGAAGAAGMGAMGGMGQ
ncbi:periplasmic heavy metal sensor [Fundidesulfovibrio agrisoli]|uniref:periplasmic heavy metal sensor n=1 Tax=Fundidesulfovibrio agrisoli TaxID=2922717 RepID=UPI001FAC81C3|nr:periplasmic heavy metal sensor [Fundidesulfovibrio agrisoli]